ncbi:oxidoreductase [Bacillus sp. AFS076308]|uniref:Gfo/Idh/MocA family protein n=1 Tax=unclassified Bacillus (in: firmicutes) TaxID=185979 RepID=UPI000BF76583|nr:MULTISPECIES: Gfo/Idh/MocA family oxidoreductase [unclassified Bacillus (in: firmicutes)]PFN99440.1 oxidoreductase [Bacillus sp. AFS076308]PGV55834.1 oxidoreductase [Bacillus sp. AFS037270]
MVKFGVIGLGDIAQKAYLPVYSSMKDLEFHFFTRNQEKVKSVGSQYRFENLHSTLESLLSSGIKGAFVHSSTVSHEGIVEQLLEHDIHVFVDKPITDHYDGAKKLVELAEQKGLILMTGFNRRYAPAYQRLKEVAAPNMVIVQKHRNALPGEPRTFIYDDFIHVVDTVRYLCPTPIDEVIVNGKIVGGILYHVVVQFISSGATALGIMNRDNGTNEEIVEVMGPVEKRSVYNVSKLVVSKGMETTEVRGSDWESTLKKRGFEQMVSDFVNAVMTNSKPSISASDALETHEICEKILSKLGS